MTSLVADLKNNYLIEDLKNKYLKKDYLIEELKKEDLTESFFETLGTLSQANYDSEKAKKTFLIRAKSQLFKTFVQKDDNNDVVGTITLLFEPKYTHDSDCVAHIEDVVVKEDCQRQGIGTALVIRAIEQALEGILVKVDDLEVKLNCYKVILDRGKKTEGFYERFGFKPHETGMRLDL